jgi:hypothetical protein
MMPTIENYLATRRAGGFDLLNAEYRLGSFASFAAGRNERHIRADTAIEWAALGPSEAQRDARLKTVRRFARAANRGMLCLGPRATAIFDSRSRQPLWRELRSSGARRRNTASSHCLEPMPSLRDG